MKNNFTKTNLFSCPIYKIRIDPNSYDKEKIINDIKYNKSLKNIRNSENDFGELNIHHSYQDFDNEDFRLINYEKLGDKYQEIFQRFFDKEIFTRKQFNWKFEIVNYTAMTEDQYLPAHFHPEDDFAAVHYLNFKKDHRLTNFENPAIFAPYVKYIRPKLFDIFDNLASDNSYFWESFEFSAEEDDMLIFPAVLNHDIRAQGPTKEPRITIATNIKIMG